MDKVQLIITFTAVIIGVVSATYLYETVDIFMPGLKKPLRTIAIGMFVIVLGIILGAFISYESSLGINYAFYSIPLAAYFYIFYIVGFVVIAIGSRGLVVQPKGKVADVSMREV